MTPPSTPPQTSSRPSAAALKRMSEEPHLGAGPLSALRSQIDELDRSLLALLEARVAIARGLGALKRAQGLDKRDPQRESEVLARLLEHAQDEALISHLPQIYRAISVCCLSAQEGSAQAPPDELFDELDELDELDEQLSELSRIEGEQEGAAVVLEPLAQPLAQPLEQAKKSEESEEDEPQEALALQELEAVDELSLSLPRQSPGVLARVAKVRPRLTRLPDEVRAQLLAQPFAHRGLHNEQLPENSLSSFQAAVEAGCGVELDVHLSADGIPVVFHDEELERMTGVEGRVSNLTLKELKALSLTPSGEPIPTLREALALIDGRRPVLVEVKNYGQPVGALEQAVAEALDEYQGLAFVQSFNPMTLTWFSKHRPSIYRGLISYGFPVEEVQLNATTRLMLRNLMFAPICKPHYVAYEYQDLARFKLKRLHKMRAKGIPLLAWTVRSEEAAHLARLRADNMIFEGFDPKLASPSAL